MPIQRISSGFVLGLLALLAVGVGTRAHDAEVDANASAAEPTFARHFRERSLAESSCATETTYDCPACGGVTVTDCLDCTGYLNTDDKNKVCFRRTLFDTSDPSYHYLWNDIVGAFVWFFAAGVATACGVGGGGIYVPLGILLLRLAPKVSSGLSQASIFGASLGGLVLNIRNRHPNKKIRDEPAKDWVSTAGGGKGAEGISSSPSIESDPGSSGGMYVPGGRQPTKESEAGDGRQQAEEAPAKTDEEYLASGHKFYTRPLIDYDMALFLAPMEMAGAVLGVLIQKLLPNWLYLILAGVILLFTSYKTYRKFFDAKKKETAARRAAKAQRRSVADTDPERSDEDSDRNVVAVAEGEANQVRPQKSDGSTDNDDASDSDDDLTDKELAQRRYFLERDSRQYPPEKLAALVLLWVGLFLLTLFKGGKGVESIVGITCESPWYGVLIALQFIWTIGFAAVFGHILLKRQEEREAVRYPHEPTDVKWDRQKLRFYSSFTFVAGIVAGLIGIGGGMVLGPLMLVMGIHPRVSSATTATMIILTSSSVAVMFVTSGLVPWEYALFFFCICFCGAYFGKRVIDGYVKKSGKASVLIFILATIIGLATIGCFVIAFMRLSAANWCIEGFKKFCDVSSDDALCAGSRLLEAIGSARSMPSRIINNAI